MQKLLSHRRVLTPIFALAALAIVCLCVGSLLLTLDYRGQLAQTKAQLAGTEAADVAQQIASYRACLLRNHQGDTAAALERADVDEQRSLISIEQADNAQPKTIRDELVNALEQKLVADENYLATAQVDCSRLKPWDVTSSSRGR